MTSRCPSCGFYQPVGGATPVANGDRILVLKCIYQFFEPRQWDVVVFKNPLDPSENYIKRLVGRAGETVEIIDGDVYIDGQISRKPPRVQNELWMPVYDNNYQPVRPREGLFNGHAWRQPFRTADSEWQIDPANPTRFKLDTPPDEVGTMVYDTSIGNNFRATYAYDNIKDYDYMPFCSDLMVRFYVRSARSEGSIGAYLSKYQTGYKAWADFSGQMVIAKVLGNRETILIQEPYQPSMEDGSFLVRFANVDHQLVFQVGPKTLTYDLERGSEDLGPRRTDIEPQVKIFGAGGLVLSNVAILRDIHYTASKFANSRGRGRAIEGNPLKLEEDEFFVLGDNSPNSEDGRWWSAPGKGNKGRSYREGIVPRDYLVGKAMFVYWPSGYRPYPRFPLGIIPNIGQMRFIYGGSQKAP
jgi:signal peptidase I